MNSQFDIDPEFNMMNEMSSDMDKKNYYAPKKFAVMTEDDAVTAPAEDAEEAPVDDAPAAPTDEELDQQEADMSDDRATYGEGYVDYESDVTERAGKHLYYFDLLFTHF